MVSINVTKYRFCQEESKNGPAHHPVLGRSMDSGSKIVAEILTETDPSSLPTVIAPGTEMEIPSDLKLLA